MNYLLNAPVALQTASALAKLTGEIANGFDPSREILLPGNPIFDAYERVLHDPRRRLSSIAPAPAVFQPSGRELITRLKDATSHKLLTPLNAALANLELLEAGGLPPDSPALGYARKAREEMLRAAAFVQGLSTLTDEAEVLPSLENSVLMARIERLFDWQPPASEPPPVPAALYPEIDPRAARILYAEDDHDLGQLTEMMMGMEGFTTFKWVENAEAALAVFEEGEREDRPFQLVVTDFRMPPGRNGVEMAREMRRKRPDLPFVFTTGSESEIRVLLTDEEQNDFKILKKVFDTDGLIQAIQEVLTKSIH